MIFKLVMFIDHNTVFKKKKKVRTEMFSFVVKLQPAVVE